MISPAFATMLCFVADRRGAGARDRRPAARRLRQALVRPHLGRRPALHQRHRDPDGVAARAACAVDARVRGRAAPRRGARHAAAPARAADRARRRGRAAGRPRGRPRRPRGAPWSRAARAVANSPLVKAALHGGDPNWGRIAQAVGARAARQRRRCRSTSGSRTCRCARARRGACRYDAAGARRARWRARRSSTRSACPGEGAEAEVFFSDLSHEYVTINAEYTT